jgi:predicted cupin superfamily sugar epimerase
MGLTAEEIKATLGLERHPTCGFVTETYRSPLEIPEKALPEAYEGARPYASALYFLVTPDAQIVLHRIRSDQLYHHYLGDPLEVLMLFPGGDGTVATVGSDLESGMRPQLLVPPARSGPASSPRTSSTATPKPWQEPTRTSGRRSCHSRGRLKGSRSCAPALRARRGTWGGLCR